MTEASRIAAEFLALPDAEFFKLDAKRASAMGLELSDRLDLLDHPSSGEEAEFIALGAPDRAPDSASSTIPFLVAVNYSELTGWKSDIRQNAFLAVTRLSDGQTALSLPFMPRDKWHRLPLLPPSRSDPPPGSRGHLGYLTGVDLFDLRRLSASADRPARLALRMLYDDFVSNGRVLEVAGARPTGTDPRRRVPASPFVKERAEGQSPLHTSLTFPSKVKTDAALSLEGCLDVAENDIPSFDDERQPGRLVSPVTVLFLRLDDKDPLLVPAFIPVDAANGRIRAAFTLSVLSAVPHAELLGGYRVYLFAGSEVAGPYALEVLP